MSRPRRTPDERLLDAAAKAGRARRVGSGVRKVRVEYAGGEVVEVEPGASPISGDAPRSRRDDVKRCVLEVLAGAAVPLQSRQLAKRCGRANTGTFRGVLSEMVHVDGTLDIVRREGYWPRDRPIPGDLFGGAA